MKRTISAMRGKGSLTHNSRQFIAENIDSSRTPLNIEYRNEDIRAVYHKLFDDALARYNEKQTRRDRVIDDYYEKIRTGKQEKLFEELIIQIGNKDDMNASRSTKPPQPKPNASRRGSVTSKSSGCPPTSVGESVRSPPLTGA